MPIVPDDYDRSPLTGEERWALELSLACSYKHPGSREAVTVRRILTRFNQPIADVFRLRHQGRSAQSVGEVQHLMQREMQRHGKMFWDWTFAEWMDTLCSDHLLFRAKHGKTDCAHMTIMDLAYLLGGVTDLRPFGIGSQITEAAQTYFGRELVTQQYERILAPLVKLGYRDGKGNRKDIRQYLSLLFVLNRSPYLEDITEDFLTAVGEEGRHMREASAKVTISLRYLNILPLPPEEDLFVPSGFDKSGMAPEWYEWCLSWHDGAVDLSPQQRKNYARYILTVGRWLFEHHPEVRTPEQWTEDLALCFRADLCSWAMGQYSSPRGRQMLNWQSKLGQPLGAEGIAHYLSRLRRYFSDLARRPHAINGEPGRRLKFDFDPKDVFSTPDHIKQALDAAEPRDIDLRVWAKLTIAAATLSTSDLPPGTRYPLSFYRAFALVWVTSARRPNEIARLRLECVREDWTPDMLDEEGHPVEKITPTSADEPEEEPKTEEKRTKIFYLHIPSGKNRGPFWLWIPDYTAEAINAWKRERPPLQRKLPDQKDREEVDYLFCYRNLRVGRNFINDSLIPALCTKAGVSREDAIGKITGHRGRSTRLTLLRRNGVGLDDLAEYAGHADSKTIRRYARSQPLQLHRTIQAADDISRIIEGVIDMQAAVQGLPALRWFIGYDADGAPMFCGNQVYVTCPHRLNCKRCGMFIGGEKARLLQEETQTLPVTSKVPMTPLEKCVLAGDQAGAQACRDALQEVPAPETPDIRLIFNPEGLANTELEKLAELATDEALDTLQQALLAHEKQLEEAQQHKTGRSALVGAQRKRITFLQKLIADCEQHQRKQKGSSGGEAASR